VTHYVADENSSARVRQTNNVKEVTANQAGGTVEVGKRDFRRLDCALFLLNPRRGEA
jgi:hypothetical protein